MFSLAYSSTAIGQKESAGIGAGLPTANLKMGWALRAAKLAGRTARCRQPRCSTGAGIGGPRPTAPPPVPAAVNWIESWLDASLSPHSDLPLEVQIAHFDYLRMDPHRMFERVFKFHGVTDQDLSKIQRAKGGTCHFRRGETVTWRTELSATDTAFADILLNGHLHAFLAR